MQAARFTDIAQAAIIPTLYLNFVDAQPCPRPLQVIIIICPYSTLVSSDSFYDMVQRAAHDLDDTFHIYRPYLLTNEGYCKNNSISPRLNREQAMTDSLRGNEPGIRPVPCFF